MPWALIARAAEGSVRDGLSILDQSIALAGQGPVTAGAVRDMLGLADRGRVAGLLDAVLKADVHGAMAAMDSAHSAGVEPQALVSGLLDLSHAVARAKLAGSADPALAEGDRALVTQWAGQLSFPQIHRLWQLLLKAHADVAQAPIPQQAAEMAVLRCVHASGLPDPEKLAKLLAEGGASLPATRSEAPVPRRETAPVASAVRQLEAIEIRDAAALVALFEQKLEPMLAKQLRDDVAVVSVQPGQLALAPVGKLPGTFAADVRRHLDDWTGAKWNVEIGASAEGVESLRQTADRRTADAHEAALAEPMVQALTQEFPGAELIFPPPPRESLSPPRLRSATS